MVLTQHFWISLSLFTAFEDQTANTRDGFVLSYRLLKLDKNATELVANSFV